MGRQAYKIGGALSTDERVRDGQRMELWPDGHAVGQQGAVLAATATVRERSREASATATGGQGAASNSDSSKQDY